VALDVLGRLLRISANATIKSKPRRFGRDVLGDLNAAFDEAVDITFTLPSSMVMRATPFSNR
jgi:hypothetical protein